MQSVTLFLKKVGFLLTLFAPFLTVEFQLLAIRNQLLVR
jgi:hypothetical protein